MLDETLYLIERFQTLTAGLIGFSGVVLALLGNAWSVRRQHARQIDHERQVLRTALRSELGILRDAYSDRIDMIDQAQQGNSSEVLVPLNTMTDAYGQLLEKLGLLSEEEVQATMTAYALVRQMPERVQLLRRHHGTAYEQESSMALVDSPLFTALRQMHQNYLQKIDEAITALSGASR